MNMNGTDLLAAYRQSGSEDAFSELVRRYTNLVYSVAKRRLSSAPLAEEVAQTVFARLAKTAPKLRSDAELVAWLHRTSVRVAIDVWRAETRRRTREQHAAAMEPAPAENTELWDRIAPSLDEALNQLGDLDRQAVLLRFFQQKPMRDIGRILGVSEDAAKMRVSRAIDRLRTRLATRGVTCTAVTLGAVLADRSVEAAPSHLVASLSSTKSAAGAAPTLGAFSLLLTLMSKAKLTSALVVLAAVGIGVIGIHRIRNPGTGSNRNIVASFRTQDVVTPGPQSRRAFGRGAGNDAAADAARTPDAAELEDLKRELRALLQTPPAGKVYPPPELTRLLTKFGPQLHEAAPILIEALGVQDYETRSWALSGLTHALNLLQRREDLEDRASQVFALARPLLSKILASPDEPSMLRLMAMHSYLPGIIYTDGALVYPPTPLGAERSEDLLAALRARDKLSDGTRYLTVNSLAEHFGQFPEDAATFVSAVQSLLSDSDPHERLLAAYALASWPGEKPSALKDVLLAEVKARTTDYSYIAAQGLGKLGAQAADAVPELLAYAEATKGWAAGYAESALDAACRLQPELRTQYPTIDSKLKQEESAIGHPMETQIYRPVEVANTLADPEQGPALRESFLAGITNSPEPERSKETTLVLLEEALAQTPENHRDTVQSTIDAVRKIDTSIQLEKTKRPPIPMSSLVLDARILLVDSNNPNKERLASALNELLAQYPQNVSESSVTPDRVRVLSKTIREIDAEFHAAWRKKVLKTYPRLDRILPPEE